MGHSVWRMQGVGTNTAVLADCHIHEDGPQFPSELLQRLQGADLIVTLGDMGEKAGLDRLQEIAPVLGVRGGDDADDMRTRRDVLVLSEGRYRIGCVFDAVASGLAVSSDPFVASDNAVEVSRRLFGSPVDVLLHAGTHKADERRFGQAGSALNPGSAVMPAEGERASFLRLKVTEDGCFGQIILIG